MKLNISCKEAVDYISKKEEKKLSLFQRWQLVRHLAICSLCRIFSKQNKTIISALSATVDTHQHQLTEEEKTGIIKAMETASE